MAETTSNASSHVVRLHHRRADLRAAHQAMIDGIARDVAAHYAQNGLTPPESDPTAPVAGSAG